MNIIKISPVRVNPVNKHADENRISLDGSWKFSLDPKDIGLSETWYQSPDLLDDEIRVPGCWQGQGFGDDSNDTVWDFGLEARTFRATYKGTGWYARSFSIPAAWRNKRVWLNFGGVHPSCDVWLNGEKLGENDLPFVPFGFEITDLLQEGKENRLVLRVHEKHRDFGLAYNWQGNWSGIYRGVELTATGKCYLRSFCIYPDVDKASIRIKADVAGRTADESRLKLTVYSQSNPSSVIDAEFSVESDNIDAEITIPTPELWSPDDPQLYIVEGVLIQGETISDALSERTGFVKLATENNHFLINEQAYYMRGSGDFISCPETGCPDTDRERWRRKLKAFRDYGYNYVRCQSYVYAPEYYDVADEMGVLVQSEMGMLGAWGSHNKWHVYQWPKPTPDNYPVLKRQWDLTVMRDVNHPSANIYCMSNEYAHHLFHFPRIAWQCYHDTKRIKPTAMQIWTDGGYGENLPGDFINHDPAAKITDKDGKTGRLIDVVDKPVIQHEFRWWSSFPDIGISEKYNGAMRPYGADIAAEAAKRQGLYHLLSEFARTSKRLQFLEAKAKMEKCRLEFEKMAGICHFNAMDANPSPQGIIDEFYEYKYADAQTWLQTNGDTVIMHDLEIDNRVFRAGQELSCRFSVSDFSHPPFQSPTISWQLTLDGKTLESGDFSYDHHAFCTCFAGGVQINIPQTDHPVKASLTAQLCEDDRIVNNHWDVWIMPGDTDIAESAMIYGSPEHCLWLKSIPFTGTIEGKELDSFPGKSVVLTEILDDVLVKFMQNGGRIILAATEGMLRPHPPNFGYVKYFFTPPANYAPYEDGQNGTIIHPHDMLGDFPHEGFADLQFYRLMADAVPIDLAPFELNDDDPIIRVIHRYPVCHPLGYLLERRFGRGGLIITALDLNQDFPEGRYLLKQICVYCLATDFSQAKVITEKSLEQLIQVTSL